MTMAEKLRMINQMEMDNKTRAAALSKRFVVGCEYEANDPGFGTIRIIKRTAKSIRVTNGVNEWMMRIKTDNDGIEYAADSSVGRKWIIALTYKASWLA